MSSFIRFFVAGMVSLLALIGGPAYAQNGTVYIVTYVDVMPNATRSGEAALRQYRDASRQAEGNLRTALLEEIARPNRFAIVEIWKDKPASDTHEKAATSAQLIDKLQTIGNAPFDRRLNNGLYGGSSNGVNERDAVYVLTHVDVVPQSKDGCMALLKAMSEDTPKDSGNVGYTVMQQANRSNHFAVFEVWADRQAADGHAEAAHTRVFREQLSPMAGALYDERFYKLVE